MKQKEKKKSKTAPYEKNSTVSFTNGHRIAD